MNSICIQNFGGGSFITKQPFTGSRRRVLSGYEVDCPVMGFGVGSDESKILKPVAWACRTSQSVTNMLPFQLA
jgi:hypothetical protein